MSWKQQLEAMGYNDSNMPNMIKKAISDYNSYLKQIQRTKQELAKDTLSDKKRDELEEEMDVLNDALTEQENVIEAKIAKWDKNKELYLSRGEKLAELARAKKGGNPTPPKAPIQTKPKETTNDEPSGQPSGVTVTTPIAKPNDEPSGQPSGNQGSEPTKKSGWGWLVVIGVVAIATFGAINLSKNE